MSFERSVYGAEVERILTDRQGLTSLIASAAAPAGLKLGVELFAESAHPHGALAGLWLYLDCFEPAHTVAQEDSSREGSLWHGIAHRREPDYGNSGYWYDRAGAHPSYPAILNEAGRLGFETGSTWKPKEFVRFCEAVDAKRVELALAVQRAEWEILFDYCARKRTV
jgi:hypothetical protein